MALDVSLIGDEVVMMQQTLSVHMKQCRVDNIHVGFYSIAFKLMYKPALLLHFSA